MHFCEQTKQTGGCSCRMRRDAAEARLAKNSGSSSRRREERMEARRSRRLQVPHTHTHPPEIPFRARDVLGREEARAEDARARAVEGGEGRDLSARLKHSTTDTFSPRNLCKLRCSSSCVRLIIPEFTRVYAC